MKKCLIVSTVSRQFTLFERVNIQILRELGYEVHCAANYSDRHSELDELDVARHFDFCIQRSPFSPKNLSAYRQLKAILKTGGYDIVHCHAPMGGVLARLAARKYRKKGMKVLYTAHGFHFYKGAPLVNNLIYRTIEKRLARYTDVLITINNEDFDAAKKMRAVKVIKTPGIGLDTSKFEHARVDRTAKRLELGIPHDALFLLSVGELIKRKNHAAVISALRECPGAVLGICGIGILHDELKELAADPALSGRVVFFGFRSDISEILRAADIFLFPSYQEGLPVALMEAMAAGLPCIVSRIRGNVDLIKDGEGGYLLDPEDAGGFADAVNTLASSPELRGKMGARNRDFVKAFDAAAVRAKMLEMYKAL